MKKSWESKGMYQHVILEDIIDNQNEIYDLVVEQSKHIAELEENLKELLLLCKKNGLR